MHAFDPLIQAGLEKSSNWSPVELKILQDQADGMRIKKKQQALKQNIYSV